MDLEAQALGEGRHFDQARQFRVAVVPAFLGPGVAIGAGMQLDHLRADAVGGLDLGCIRGNEDADAAPRLAQGGDVVGEVVLLACDLEAAFGRPLLALFGHDADRVRPVAQGDGLHLGRRGHLEVQRTVQRLYQRLDIGVRDVAPVLAQMRRNAVGARRLGDARRAHRVGHRATARVADGGDVVDVDPQPEFSRHRALSPLVQPPVPGGGPPTRPSWRSLI